MPARAKMKPGMSMLEQKNGKIKRDTTVASTTSNGSNRLDLLEGMTISSMVKHITNILTNQLPKSHHLKRRIINELKCGGAWKASMPSWILPVVVTATLLDDES
jgi:hypothetical protein